VGEYAKDVCRCYAVGHLGEGLGHLANDSGHFAPFLRIEARQLLEQRRGSLRGLGHDSSLVSMRTTAAQVFPLFNGMRDSENMAPGAEVAGATAVAPDNQPSAPAIIKPRTYHAQRYRGKTEIPCRTRFVLCTPVRRASWVF